MIQENESPLPQECPQGAPDGVLAPEPERQRHLLRLHYNGQAYCGTQFQVDAAKHPLPTIQHTVQQALAQLGLGKVTVNFCSRTDAGVHALGQVAHFDTPPGALKNIIDLPRAINSVLPADISVVAAARNVGLGFHSRRSARRKWYRYAVYTHPRRSALMPSNTAWLPQSLEIDALNEAACAILGSHTFSSFKCPNTPVLDDGCTVAFARWTQTSPHTLHFDIVADRYLYKMVRNLVGAMLVVGQSHNPLQLGDGLPRGTMQAALAMENRAALGKLAPTAKADGLTLMAIDYNGPQNTVEGIGCIRSHPALDVQLFFNDDVHLHDFPACQALSPPAPFAEDRSTRCAAGSGVC